MDGKTMEMEIHDEAVRLLREWEYIARARDSVGLLGAVSGDTWVNLARDAYDRAVVIVKERHKNDLTRFAVGAAREP